MLCLKCHIPITPEDEICPNPSCSVYLPSLFRDLLAPGVELLNGTYRIDHALGRGGFGVTYRATHTVFSRSVAIKEFYPQDFAHREGRTGTLVTPANAKDKYQKWLERFKGTSKFSKNG